MCLGDVLERKPTAFRPVPFTLMTSVSAAGSV